MKIRKFLPRAVLKRKLQSNRAKQRDRHLEAGVAKIEELAGQFHEFNDAWIRRQDPSTKRKAIERLHTIYGEIRRLARIKNRVPKISSVCRELGVPGYRPYLNGHRLPTRHR